MSRRPVIALLTDFGEIDPYVGMMKGVIAQIAPEANVIDVTHQVPPQDIRTGAFFLEHAARYFPQGTVHVAVVDPGVGSSRAPIAFAAMGQFFVGPDNGLFSFIKPRTKAVLLRQKVYFGAAISQTFHGRDIFAPVAAHLAMGIPLASFGPVHPRLVTLARRMPREVRGGLDGAVVSVDRFGNLITNISAQHWKALARPRVLLGDVTVARLSQSYADAAPGALLAIIGSYGLLEIAVNGASARERLGWGSGAPVRLREHPPNRPKPRAG